MNFIYSKGGSEIFILLQDLNIEREDKKERKNRFG